MRCATKNSFFAKEKHVKCVPVARCEAEPWLSTSKRKCHESIMLHLISYRSTTRDHDLIDGNLVNSALCWVKIIKHCRGIWNDLLTLEVWTLQSAEINRRVKTSVSSFNGWGENEDEVLYLYSLFCFIKLCKKTLPSQLLARRIWFHLPKLFSTSSRTSWWELWNVL